jgi:hypothetical protein
MECPKIAPGYNRRSVRCQGKCWVSMTRRNGKERDDSHEASSPQDRSFTRGKGSHPDAEECSVETPGGFSADEPDPDDGEVIIEREGERDAVPLHDGETGGVHGRQFVEVPPTEILPSLLKIVEVAQQDLERCEGLQRTFPSQSYVPVCVAIEEREGFENYWNGGAKFGAVLDQNLPKLASAHVQRIARQREGDPCAGIDKNLLSVTH